MKNLLSPRLGALVLLTIFLGAQLALSGCRTMEGAGKDIERAGEKIQDNAK